MTAAVRVLLAPLIESWHQHELYGRVDILGARSATLLWNPGVVYRRDRSPNGFGAVSVEYSRRP